MNFSENLQTLRKERGWTQEQLAELLQVSRQAVTKWESGQSSPDLERIMQICQLFDCDLNTLVQGTIPTATQTEQYSYETFLQAKTQYEAGYRRQGLAIAGGVCCILWGVTLFIFLGGFGLEAIGVLILLSLIAIATFLFIYFGMQFERFQAEQTTTFNYYDAEERNQFHKRFSIAIGLGVMLVLLGVILCVGLALLNEASTLAPSAMMLCVTIATGIFIYFGIQQEKYQNAPVREPGQAAQEVPAKPKEDDISGTIMLIATAIFLIAGFVFHRWHPAWVVFPIGGILCGIVENFQKRPRS